MVMLFSLLPMGSNASASTFSDLPATHWAHAEIIDLASRGIINGFPDGTYRPENAVTREQFARLVIATLGESSTDIEDIFEDVPQNHWSNAYVTAAVRRGIFCPSEYGVQLGAGMPITREEAAVWMVRALGIEIGGTLGFADTAAITHRDEVAAAVDIGLILGMPSNLFAPAGSTTRAQAAVLVTRMSNILEELTVWDYEEVLHYVYRSDVTVVSAPPEYSYIEQNDTIIITVYSPTNAIRQLAIGDTFILEPTEQNPFGLAGHVISISEQGTNIVIMANIPESLEEIFYEFEFVGEIDILAEDILFIDIEGEYHPDDYTEAARNRTSMVNWNFNRTHGGINVRGNVRVDTPRVRARLTLRGVDELVLIAGASVTVHASSSGNVNHVIPIGSISVSPVWGC